jgi:type 1 glutamine amidotransferase
MNVTRRSCLQAAAVAATMALPFSRRALGEADAPLHVVLLSGSAEYHSDDSLTALGEAWERKFKVHCTKVFGKDGAGDPLPGIEALDTADLVVVFTRRLRPPKEQLQRFQKYCESGKPIIGIRTASHAFQDWLVFDKEVLGGNYQNHYSKKGDVTQVAIVDKAKGHPILAGVEPFKSEASLYKNTGIAEDAELLLTGTIPGHTEPLAWTHEHKGGRVFYVSLGAPEDFKEQNFVRLLDNSLEWVTKRELKR